MGPIEQGDFDYGNLTPEQWFELRGRIESQARAARTRALRDLLRNGIAWLRAAGNGAREAAHLAAGFLAGVPRRWWGAYAARRERRAAVRELAALDDRTLKDIGLSRSEIEYVVYGQAIGRWREGAALPAGCDEASAGMRPRTGSSLLDRPALDKRAAACAPRRHCASDVVRNRSPFVPEPGSARLAEAARRGC
jgi:uncharacterized protein YjiS (DUF1127 family)